MSLSLLKECSSGSRNLKPAQQFVSAIFISGGYCRGGNSKVNVIENEGTQWGGGVKFGYFYMGIRCQA